MQMKPTIEKFEPPFAPCLCEVGIQRLDELSRDADVLEVGGGSSTAFFAERANSLYTIEHDEDWMGVIRSTVPESDDVRLRLVDKDDIARTVKYLRNDSYDLVFIDCYQYQRRAALENSMTKVRVGGHIAVDDFHFPELQDIDRLMSGWEKEVIVGKKVHPIRGGIVASNLKIYKRCS
jgi:predicted O-methyltransferase YrrM